MQFSYLCKEYIRKGHVRFIADASEMEFIDSCGIGVLLKNKALLAEYRGDLQIRNLAGNAAELFDKMRLAHIFKIENTGDSSSAGKATPKKQDVRFETAS